jgi:hypothetical protein
MNEVINEDGTPVLIEAVYYRYHQIGIYEADSVEDAQSFIDGSEDNGYISSVGVFVEGEPHSSGPWNWRPPKPGDDMREIDGMRREYAKAKAIG